MEEQKQTEMVSNGSLQVLSSEEIQTKEGNHPNEAVDHLVDRAFETCVTVLEASDEMKNYSGILSNGGHAFRESLIRDAKDLSTKEKLAASRDNDMFELQRLDKAKDIANDIRDNKVNNESQMLLTLCLPVAFIIAMYFPHSRAFIAHGFKTVIEKLPNT